MNNDVIKLLPDSVANQIAAGEVIQRPASVVKELVENAVDAGATRIQIILKDAGRTLIQVVDNGCGMSATDARLAFERHSTSKISDASDLFSLHTMGFRGEALASIAAIAQVDLRTMRHGDSIGTRLLINGSKVESQQPEACAPGSNMMVKNLFFNVPARRKFLKKDSVELSNIMHEFERLALVNTHIEFTITHNDVVLHQLMGGALLQRIGMLFGKSIEKQVLPVVTDTSIVKIDGFVSRPENARKRGALQYFMVNGRNMRHPYFHKAVMTCYEQLIPAEEQPNYFINFTVDPETIDVNIHPQKHEIKFENEQPIWQIIVAAIKEALGRFNAVPSIDFDMADAPDIPVFNPDATRMPEIQTDPTYNPFDLSVGDSETPTTPTSWGTRPSKANTQLDDWESLYENFTRKRSEGLEEARSSAINSLDFGLTDETYQMAASGNAVESSLLGHEDDAPSVMTAPIQLKGRYIVSPAKTGLLVVDQHRAHVKILYEEYISLASAGNMTMQRIIFPEVVSLSTAQSSLLDSNADRLAALGFDLSFLGDGSWAINGIPSVMSDVDPTQLILSLADSLENDTEDVSGSTNGRIAMAMARQAAVKPGTSLTPEEMDHILGSLLKMPSPNYTPDGLLVLSVIPTEEIARLFA